MKKSIISLIFTLVTGMTTFGQLTGTKSIPGDYASVASAISTLNATGVGPGGVTFNVASGYSETFASLTSGLITTTGSPANPILFKKNGTGANPVITAASGTSVLTEYIICLQGADYITFDGINVTDPSGTVEWGYAILKASGTNGSQNITIRNCDIIMKKTNSSTAGIYSNNMTPAAPSTQLTVTALSGTNSYFKLFNNTIQNAYNGIYLAGFNDPSSPYIYYDQNNEIGKDGANTISNFGGGATANNGIYTIYQNNQKIANNNISGPVEGAGACSGIMLGTANNASMDIYNNTISIVYNGTGAFYGIQDVHGNIFSGATVMNVNNNTVTNCTYPNAAKGTCYYISFLGGAATSNFYNNIVTNNTYGSASATATGNVVGFTQSGNQNLTGIVSIHDNQVTNNNRIQSVLGGGNTYYMWVNGGGTQCDIFNNLIDNNNVASNGLSYGLYALNNSINKNVFDNTVTNILNAYGTVEGITVANSNGSSVYRNKIQNINALGTASIISGINLSTLANFGNMYCYNNYVGDLKTPASALTYAIYGIKGNGSNVINMGIYNNTVLINATSTAVNFGTYGLYFTYLPFNIEVRNNIIVNTSVANGTGYTAALGYYDNKISNYSLSSNNNDFYAGIPGPKNLIFYAGANQDQTLGDLQSRFSPGESQSLTENPPFVNAASTPMNLHINPAAPTQVESAGVVITAPNITTDFDNDPRYPNPGYPVNPSYPPSAPDMGADEFGGIPLDVSPPVISFTPLTNTASLAARTLVATITDKSGVPTAGAGLPRIAYKKFYNGTWSYITGTSTGGAQFSFLFGGGAALGDSIYYYVVAQDSWVTPNTGSFPVTGASGFSANPPACTTAPASPLKYTIVQGICGTFNVGTGQIYPTLTAAINDINSKEMTCPVTFLLTDNAYTSETYPIVIKQIAGASAVNTLTIKPAAGVTPVFSSAYLGVTPNFYSLITLNGAQNIIIDGSNSGGTDRSLTFQNNATGGFAAAIGLYNNGMTGASNIVIKNCVIQAHPDLSANAQGIVLYGATGNAGYKNITINNNAINSAKIGINIWGIGINKTSNIQVTNNTIGSLNPANFVVQNGIYLTLCDNVLIQGNEIIGPATGMAVTQPCVGVLAYIGSTNLKIRKNIIHDLWSTTTSYPGSGCMGILFQAEATSLTEISNNVIYNIKAPGLPLSTIGGSPFGIFVQWGGNMQIYSNSIYMNGSYMSASVAGATGCLGFGGNNSYIDVKNNIFKNSSQPVSGTPTSKTYAVTMGLNLSAVTLNYNDYFVDGIGPKIGYFGGADQVTLANWQAATSQDANTINIDPVFTSANYLVPTSSYMNHSGTYLPSVPTDILGINRTNPPDAGAYEFSVNPVVVTTSATNISPIIATLNGTINAANNIVSSFFDYGLTTSYGISTPGSPASITGSVATPCAVTLSGLTPVTTYHFRAKGITSSGITVYGNDMTFNTLNFPPVVTTTAATFVTTNSATMNGTVNANGATTEVTFEYGPTNAYGTMLPGIPSPIIGLAVTSISAPLTGLLPNTTYHFRVNGVNSAGLTTGNDMTFTTAAILANVFTTLATSLTANTANLNGMVTANYAATVVTFEYGITTAYGSTVNANPATVNGITATAVSAAVSGLSINTLYHFRCVGVNAAGTSYGLDQTFTTNCIAPVINIAGPATVCVQSIGNTYTTQAGNTNYQWTITAGGTITSGQGTNTIMVNWNTLGAQSVGVNYQNFFGCSALIPVSYLVTVNEIPTPTITGPATVCILSTGIIYTTQTGNSNYTWTVSTGGTITAGQGTNVITVIWNTTGAQAVNVNYTNANGCVALVPAVLNVTANPLPTPTIIGQNNLCANSGYFDYSTESGQTGYVWTVSAGGTITSGQGTNAIEATWNVPGVQTVGVNYANVNGCFAPSATILAVAVNGAPGAAGSITGSSAVCGGALGIAYSCGPITGAVYYEWTLPAGATIATGAGTTNITVNYTANASSGNISVYGNNICGNGTASPNFALTLTALPAAAGPITGSASLCAGTTGVVYSVPAIANATSYIWTVPAGATITMGATTNQITVSYGTTPATGVITVEGSNSCGSGAVSPNFYVTVNAIPSAPVVTAVGNVLTSSSPTGNQWYYDNTGAIPGATGQTYTVVNHTGWYWCTVTTNGCTSPISNKVYMVVTGVPQLPANASFTLYPVPNDGRFKVSIQYPTDETFTIEILNQIGSRIYELKDVSVTGGSFEKQIDLRPVAIGIYTVVLRNSEMQVIKKIIVRN